MIAAEPRQRIDNLKAWFAVSPATEAVFAHYTTYQYLNPGNAYLYQLFQAILPYTAPMTSFDDAGGNHPPSSGSIRTADTAPV
jgi:hypothetical protein